MSVLVFVLAASAACLLHLAARRRWPAAGRRAAGSSRRPRPWPRATDRRPVAPAMPRLVRQLSSLLAAGRNGPQLWGGLAAVLAAERPGDDATLQVVLAVQRATALGLPTAGAIVSACRQWAPPGQRGAWQDLAACFQVCESSGAPVAAVLARLAARMDAEADAAALRETALSGPQATVRLLTWLPFLGLVLGIAMGVDPLGTLIGSPIGWACLLAGLAFTWAGRAWSGRLVAHAAGFRGAGSRAAGSRRSRGRGRGVLRVPDPAGRTSARSGVEP